ncbi:ABC transporter permease [Thauera sinica]|nr:ABC transporter permease [Thauera sp. K11]
MPAAGVSRRFGALFRALALGASLAAAPALAEPGKLRVGLMMSYSGTYAGPSNAATNGFKQYVAENGGRLGGLEVEYFQVDDEADPSRSTENASKLIKRDRVDVVIGAIHSGVALGLAKVARETGTLMIVPNAAADELTGALCAPNIFRTSFSSWQPSYAMGGYVAKKHGTAVTLTWKYAAGLQMVEGFKEAYGKGGGRIVREMTLPFPNVEFQPFLTEIAALKPEAVYVFFAGAGAAKFVRDYVASGLSKRIPLYAPGFLTDGTLEAMGEAGQGLLTTLHYADGLKNPRDDAFRLNYAKAYKSQPDVYAVQGYDAAQLLAAGLDAVKGDLGRRKEMIAAMEAAKIDSPRGAFTLSRSHNPVQDIYLRRAEGRENNFVEVSAKALADPGRGCRM